MSNLLIRLTKQFGVIVIVLLLVNGCSKKPVNKGGKNQEAVPVLAAAVEQKNCSRCAQRLRRR